MTASAAAPFHRVGRPLIPSVSLTAAAPFHRVGRPLIPSVSVTAAAPFHRLGRPLLPSVSVTAAAPFLRDTRVARPRGMFKDRGPALIPSATAAAPVSRKKFAARGPVRIHSVMTITTIVD